MLIPCEHLGLTSFPFACRYVQQDDVLPGTSSVWEYLSFHARLRLPADCSRERREARVWRVIQQLGLSKVRMALVKLTIQQLRSCAEALDVC